MDILETIRKKFSSLAALPDKDIDLVGAALLIARMSYPQLDETVYRRYLSELAGRLRNRLNEADRPTVMIEKLNRILFEEEGFRGNRRNYFDPDNSYINRVVDRKLGIPITLSLIYTEAGKQAGMNLYGISLPVHFIAALSHKSGRILIDPFNRGEILSEEECRTMVRRRLSESEARAFDTRQLNPARPKEILIRMLRNLKAIYLQTNNDMKAFQVLHWILILDPGSMAELRERGLLYEALGDTGRAVEDLERYLEHSPGPETERIIGSKIEELKKRTTRLH
ncbi:MAG: tetratricopeptide repeat protein [Deltaproteobacteria bacterium]|nr:tetratricopeptide repeat protein [Deltaproteobacteria bacterium]